MTVSPFNHDNQPAVEPMPCPIPRAAIIHAPHGALIYGKIPICDMKGACGTKDDFALAHGRRINPRPFHPVGGGVSFED